MLLCQGYMEEIFRTSPLAAPELTAPPHSLLSLIGSTGTHYKHGLEYINPADHHLAAFHYNAKGECFFSSIAKAVYGTETYHFQVRAAVCDFIDTFIRHADFENDQASREMIGYSLGKGDNVTWTNESFDTAIVLYLSYMRKAYTPATELEIGITCYMFRLRILLLARIDKYYPERDKPVSRIHRATIKGSGCAGVDFNWVKNNKTAVVGERADVTTIVMLFSTHERVDRNGIQQAQTIADCGHYELLYNTITLAANHAVPMHMPLQSQAGTAAEIRRQNALGRGIVVGLRTADISSVFARGISEDTSSTGKLLPFKNTCTGGVPATRVANPSNIQGIQNEIHTLHAEIEKLTAAKDERLLAVIAKINQHQNELRLHSARLKRIITENPIDMDRMEACQHNVSNSNKKVAQYEDCKRQDATYLDSLKERLAHLSQVYGAQSGDIEVSKSPLQGCSKAATSDHSQSSVRTIVDCVPKEIILEQDRMQIDAITPVGSKQPKTVCAPVSAGNRTSIFTTQLLSTQVADDQWGDSELVKLHDELVALKVTLQDDKKILIQEYQKCNVRQFDKAQSVVLSECLERVRKQERIIALQNTAYVARRLMLSVKQ